MEETKASTPPAPAPEEPPSSPRERDRDREDRDSISPGGREHGSDRGRPWYPRTRGRGRGRFFPRRGFRSRGRGYYNDFKRDYHRYDRQRDPKYRYDDRYDRRRYERHRSSRSRSRSRSRTPRSRSRTPRSRSRSRTPRSRSRSRSYGRDYRKRGSRSRTPSEDRYRRRRSRSRTPRSRSRSRTRSRSRSRTPRSRSWDARRSVTPRADSPSYRPRERARSGSLSPLPPAPPDDREPTASRRFPRSPSPPHRTQESERLPPPETIRITVGNELYSSGNSERDGERSRSYGDRAEGGSGWQYPRSPSRVSSSRRYDEPSSPTARSFDDRYPSPSRKERTDRSLSPTPRTDFDRRDSWDVDRHRGEPATPPPQPAKPKPTWRPIGSAPSPPPRERTPPPPLPTKDSSSVRRGEPPSAEVRPLLPHQKEPQWRSPSPKNDEFAIPGLGDLDMEEEDKFLYGEKVDVATRRDSRTDPPSTPTVTTEPPKYPPEQSKPRPVSYPDRAKLEVVLRSVGIVGLDPNDVIRGPGRVEDELKKRVGEELVKKVMLRQREWMTVPPEAPPVTPTPAPAPGAPPPTTAPPYPGYPPHPQYPPQPGYPYAGAPQGYPGYHYGYYPPAGYPPHPHDPAAVGVAGAAAPPPMHPGQYYPPQPYPPQMNYGYPPVHGGGEHPPQWPPPVQQQPPQQPTPQPAPVAPAVQPQLAAPDRGNLKVIPLQVQPATPTQADKKPDTDKKPASEEAKIPQNPEEWKKMRAVQEQYKRKLELLQEEQERLRKQQGELMRKKQRQKDGHNDPLLVANSKLQEEMSRQIESIRGSLINLTRALKATLHLCAPQGRDPRVKPQYPTQYPGAQGQSQPQGPAPVAQAKPLAPAPPPALAKREFEGPLPPASTVDQRMSSQGQWHSLAPPSVKIDDRERDRLRPPVKEVQMDLTPPQKDPRVSRVAPVGKVEVSPRTPPEVPDDVEYVDGGNHWCKYCHDIFPMISDLLKHLHSKHSPAQLFVSREPPWSTSASKQPPPVKSGTNPKHVPMKGVEFIIPSSAYFCNLCKEFMGDTVCAFTHLRGKKHNDNATKYAAQHPNYDKRLSTVSALAKKEEMKRRQEEEEQEMAKRRKMSAAETHPLPKTNRDRIKERYESRSRGSGEKERGRYGDLDREGFGDDRVGSSSQKKDIKLNLVNKRSGYDDDYYERKYRGGDRYDRPPARGDRYRGSRYRDSSDSSRDDSDSDSRSRTCEDDDAPKPKIEIKMKGKMGMSAFQKQAAAAQKKPSSLTAEQQKTQRILSTVLKKMKKGKDDGAASKEAAKGGGETQKGTDFEAMPMDIEESAENGVVVVVAEAVVEEPGYAAVESTSHVQVRQQRTQQRYGPMANNSDEESDSEPAVPGEENVRIGEIPLPNRMVAAVQRPSPPASVPPPTTTTTPFQSEVPKAKDVEPQKSENVQKVLESTPPLPDNVPECSPVLPDRIPEPAPSLPDSVPEPASNLPDSVPELAANLPGKVPELVSNLPDKVQEPVPNLPVNIPELAADVPEPVTILPGNVPELASNLPGKVPESVPNLPELAANVLDSVPGPAPNLPDGVPELATNPPDNAPEQTTNLPDDVPGSDTNLPDNVPEPAPNVPGNVPEQPLNLLDSVPSPPISVPEQEPCLPEPAPEEAETPSTKEAEVEQEQYFQEEELVTVPALETVFETNVEVELKSEEGTTAEEELEIVAADNDVPQAEESMETEGLEEGGNPYEGEEENTVVVMVNEEVEVEPEDEMEAVVVAVEEMDEEPGDEGKDAVVVVTDEISEQPLTEEGGGSAEYIEVPATEELDVEIEMNASGDEMKAD